MDTKCLELKKECRREKNLVALTAKPFEKKNIMKNESTKSLVEKDVQPLISKVDRMEMEVAILIAKSRWKWRIIKIIIFIVGLITIVKKGLEILNTITK